jgi:hypothetical protein
VGHFLPSWIRIRMANPAPDTDRDPIESGSNPDMDPQHWLKG